MWHVLRDWIQGELVTSDHMNEQVRDNLGALATRDLVVQIGAPGAGVIGTGVKVYVEIPSARTITGWTLLANAPGSIVIDVWKAPYASFPPLLADTIAGTEKPTLAAAQKAQDLTLTTWDGDLDSGDVLAINVDSASTVETVTLTLRAIPR